MFSTSTRNFPNRLGKNANVYLGSAELAAICSQLGRIPTAPSTSPTWACSTRRARTVYQYLNFDQIDEFKPAAVAA